MAGDKGDKGSRNGRVMMRVEVWGKGKTRPMYRYACSDHIAPIEQRFFRPDNVVKVKEVPITDQTLRVCLACISESIWD